MTNQLEEFLLQKKQEMDAQAIDHKSIRDDWLASLRKLYQTIQDWLAPLIEKEFLTIEFSEVAITETLLGSYEAPCMTLCFFSGDKVELIPKGYHIITGKGRVDLKLGLREVMIVGQEEEPGWFFAERIGRGQPRHFDFSKPNFEELLQEFMETNSCVSSPTT